MACFKSGLEVQPWFRSLNIGKATAFFKGELIQIALGIGVTPRRESNPEPEVCETKVSIQPRREITQGGTPFGSQLPSAHFSIYLNIET